MALYRVTGPDGNTYEVNGPEGATDAQIIAAVQKEIEAEDYARSVMETRDVGLMENILSGLGAGAVGTLESAALGGATLLDEEQELKAREAIQSAAKYVRPSGGDPEDLSYKLASGVGSLGAFLGTALLGPAALPAAGALAIGAGAGEASERARAAGVSEEVRNDAAFKGIFVGATEILPLGRFVSRLGVPVLTDMVNKLGPKTVATYRDRIRNAAVTGGIEGAQEATAAVLQNAIEQGYNPDQTLLNGAAEEGGIGAFAGALLGLFLPGKTRDAAVDDAKDQADEILALPAPQLKLPAPETTVPEEAPTEVLGLGYEPTRTITMPDGSTQEVPSEFVERARIQEQEARAVEEADQQRRRAESEQGLAALQRVAREEAQTQELTREQELPEAELMALEEQRARGRAGDEQTDMFTLQRELEALQARPEETRAEPTEQLEIPEVTRSERGQVQREMFGPRGGVQRQPADTRQPEPKAGPQQQDMGFEQQQEQQEMLGPRGGVLRQPRTRALPRTPEVAPEVTPEAAKEQLSLFGPKGAPTKAARQPAAQPAPKAERKPVTATDLKNLGIPKISGAYNVVLGKDLNDPAQRQEVSVALDNYAETGRIKPKTKQKIQDFIAKADQDVQPVETKPAAGGKGTKPSVPSTPEQKAPAVGRGATKPTGTGRTGLGASKPDTATTPVRAESKPTTLKAKPTPAAAKPAPVAAKPTPVAKKPAPVAAKKPAPVAAKPAAVKPSEKKLPPYDKTLGRPLDMTVLDVKLPQSDTKKISALPDPKAERKEKVTPEVAAGMYFRRYKRPVDALEAMAFDIANKETGYTKTGNNAIDLHFEGTSAKSALKAKSWIEENLTPSTKNLLDLKIREQAAKKNLADKAYQRLQETKKQEDEAKIAAALRKEKARARAEKETRGAERNIDALNEFSATSSDINKLAAGLEAEIGAIGTKDVSEMSVTDRNKIRESLAADVQAYLDAGGKIELLLTKDSVIDLTMQVHPAVSEMLRNGDLQGALYALSKTGASRRIRKVAAKLADKIGTTKVVVEKNLKDSAGNSVAAFFDPKTNTIKINSDYTGSAHTLLHEVTHAVTSATLANKSHPLTKQLQKLYDSVKDQLSTHYGAQSLDEFVAEVYTNPEFRAALSRVYPTDSNTSALRKFMNSVVNFFRRLFGADTQTKLTDDNLNQIIETIMAPAPNMRNAGELYLISSEGTIGKFMNRMGGAYVDATRQAKRVPESDFMNRVSDFFKETVPKFTKKAIIVSLPSQAAADQTDRLTGSKKAYRLHELFEEQEGATNKSDNRLDATANSLENWRKNNPDKVETFDRIIANSTIEEVDPSKPRTDYKGDKALEWDKLQADWKALEKSGREQYTQLRDAYRTMYDQLVESIETNLGPQARRVFLNIFPKQRIEPYFPLVRKGDYWLKYNDPNGEYTFEAFETAAARNRQVAALKAAGATSIETVNDLSKARFDNAPSTSFVGQVIQIMQANNVKNEVIDDTMRLFVQMLPATSFAKALQKREGIAGFRSDALFAFREKAYNLGRQVVQFQYSKDIRTTMEELREEVLTEANKKSTTLDSTTANVIIEEWSERSEFAINPPTDVFARAARMANRIAFLGTIGFYASSAIVNFSQLPLFVLPYLAGRTTFKEAVRNMQIGMKLFNGSGFSHRVPLMGAGGKTIKIKGMPSIDNYYQADENGVLSIRTDIEIDDKADYYDGMTKRQLIEAMMPLVQKASDRGLLNRSLFYDTLGAEMSGSSKNLWDRINAYSAFMFHTVERHNRQVSLVANFLNEINRMKNNPLASKGETNLSEAELMQRAVDNALYETQQTNGGAVLATAPRIAQKDLGRVAMMYKTYGIQMYYTQLKTGFEAIKMGESDPEARRIAQRQLVGTSLAVLLMSGVQGLTLFGIAAGIANLFLDDEEEDAETLAREYLGEGMYKGLLNQITGVDVAARIGLSNLIMQSNRYNFDPSMEKTIISTLGGPFYGYTSQFIRGTKDLLDGEVQRGVENMLPSAFRSMAKTFRYASEDGINTRRGDPILDDLSYGDLAAQFMGFAPADYTRNQERNQVLKRIDRNANEKRTKLLRKYYVALRFGDSQGMADTASEIQAFNRKHPSAAITPETIKRSMAQHMDTSRTMYNGVTLSPNMRAKLEDIGRGFE
jgi:hypothetical protein